VRVRAFVDRYQNAKARWTDDAGMWERDVLVPEVAQAMLWLHRQSK